ncbi:zinc finger protein Xfin-like [Sphaeramia orbicularis]|uniref:zinc finger protein Xfin-like n=1 Tax=Sphaeramia orbicularis TaxID=375764 RepID=UPI0011803A02|nr:zinc finger protein Xfin-like [Sphaeramia orbicularis]
MCFLRCVEEKKRGKMCEMQKLRVSVEQILTAAAEEIFGVFQRSIAEIEEKLSGSLKHKKRNQRLPDTVHQTDILIPPQQQRRSPHVDQEDLGPPYMKEDQEEEWINQEGEQTMKVLLLSECPTLTQKLWMVKEELPLEQQDRSPSLDYVDPEPPHTKEEENLWTNQEGEQLQGLEEADITKFPSTPPHVKSEYDKDKAQSSQLHQSQTEENTEEPEDGDYYGGSEPDSIQNNDFPISVVACKTTQYQSTEDDNMLSVEQILTAAAEEIFGVFQRSIAEIEEKLSGSLKHKKRNQRLPDTVHQTDIRIPPEQQGRSPHVDQEDPEPPHIKEEQEDEWISQEGEQTMKLLLLSECPTLNQKLWMVKEELPLEQQDRSPSLDQVNPEPPHTKEEENLWTNQEGEQLQGLEEADITKFPSTPPHVKSEYDEDKAQSSQLHQSQTEENTEEPEDGDYYGGSEPDSIQNNDFPISVVACKTTHQSTEDDQTCMSLSVSETQMTVHTTKKRFCCSVCNKGFVHKSNLNRHMLVHPGEKPFICSVCNKGFVRRFEVRQHMVVSHPFYVQC